MTSIDIRHGDCLEVLRSLDDNSVDSVTTDPPYGLSNTKPAQVADVLAAWVTGDTEAVPAKKGGFMGADWDSFVPPPAVWQECLRVLKPGGHMAVFAGSRTQDLMGLSIRLAGFEIRDTLGWIYGSGMPKSLDVSKAIDKQRNDKQETLAVTSRLSELASAAGISRKDVDSHMGTSDMGGWWLSTLPHRCVVPSVENWAKLRDFIPGAHELDAEVWRLNGRKGTPGEAWEKREVVGVREVPQGHAFAGSTYGGDSSNKSVNVTSSHSDAAKQWDGWGTALKPAIEPIILARKPLDGTVANNVLAHGVGGLNIDASRVGSDGGTVAVNFGETRGAMYGGGKGKPTNEIDKIGKGRFPANVLLDEHAAKEMDEQSGWQKDGTAVRRNRKNSEANPNGIYSSHVREAEPDQTFGSGGGASRFFPVFKYQAKAPKKERPVIVREDGTKVQHPTVKPLSLMSWIVTLTTPEGGTVLDPFAGTGTTLQAARDKGFGAIGVEQDEDYIQLIEQRLGGVV